MPTIDLLGSTINIRDNGSISNVGFVDDIALIGGYNATDAPADTDTNTKYEVTSGSRARTLFGTNSELTRAASVASANPVDTMHCFAVPETTTTESISTVSSGTLSNAPLFDPSVHPEHTITVTDVSTGTDMTVEIGYEESVTAPGTADTFRVNPVTGDWVADSASDYEVTYTYGDYTTAIERAVQQNVRYIVVLSEADVHATKLLTELTAEAKDGNPKRGITGARPGLAVSDGASYTPSTESYRMVEVTPARGRSPEGAVRTTAAIGGLLAGQPINADGAITYDDVGGLVSLRTEYRGTEAQDTFSQLTPIDRSGTVVQGRTTSSTTKFSRIHAVEILDAVLNALFELQDNYGGRGSFPERSQLLIRSVQRTLQTFAESNPPLLAQADGTQPYSVRRSSTEDPYRTVLEVGVAPAPVMEEIVFNLNVGNVTTAEVEPQSDDGSSDETSN